MIDKMAELARRMAALPGTEVDFTTFPSGSAMLDVRRDGHLYVMAYSPAWRFGVDEVRDGEGFLLSYRFTSGDFEPAAERLWEFVRGTQQALAGEPPGAAAGRPEKSHPGAAGTGQPVEADRDPS
jgi:hypothetical protein